MSVQIKARDVCFGSLGHHSGHFYNRHLVTKASGQKPWFSRTNRLGSAAAPVLRLKGWWWWKAGRGDLFTPAILETVWRGPVTSPYHPQFIFRILTWPLGKNRGMLGGGVLHINVVFLEVWSLMISAGVFERHSHKLLILLYCSCCRDMIPTRWSDPGSWVQPFHQQQLFSFWRNSSQVLKGEKKKSK